MFVGRTNANVFARPLDPPAGIVQLDAKDTWKKVYLGFKPDVVIVSGALKGSGYRMHSFYIKDYENEVKNYHADGYRYTLNYRWWYEYPAYNCLRIEDDGFSVKITQSWNYTESEENQMYYFASSKDKPELLTLEHNKGRAKIFDEEVRVELGTRPEMLQVVAKNDTGKNQFNCTLTEPVTKMGVTLTPVIENGYLLYIDVDGTSSTSSGYSVGLGTFTTTVGKTYILSGCPDINGSGKKCRFSCNPIGVDYGSGVTSSEITESKSGQVIFTFQANTTFDHEKIYPMIREATIEDPTYEPYTGEEPSSTFRNYIYFDEKYDPENSSYGLANAMPCNVGTYGEQLDIKSIKTYPEHDLVAIDDTGFTFKPGLGEYIYYVRPLPGEIVA